MPRTLRQKRKSAARLRTTLDRPVEYVASSGTVTIAACHPDGPELSPVIHTSLRKSTVYRDMHDVEIRGFHAGKIKFLRNVATQYHVRVGYENMSHTRGHFELMRVLQQWSLSAFPASASVQTTRLVLHQEDHRTERHYWPLHWPVTFYLYEVKRDWQSGRGGVDHDNLSPPEVGDAWWLESRAGEEMWREPGCGYGSDTDANADRGGQPLAAATLHGPDEPLVFTGTRLAAHVENLIRARQPLNVIVQAGREQEILPGSIRCFYSAEFGEDDNAELRPHLEVEWQAPAVWTESHPFVLEPATTCFVTPHGVVPQTPDVTVCASLEADPLPESPSRSDCTLTAVRPEIHAVGLHGSPEPRSLLLPVTGQTTEAFRVRLSTAIRAIAAGDEFSTSLLETWTPSQIDRAAVTILFHFTSPSQRRLTVPAVYAGDCVYECRFRPDEMGIWSYEWETQPDRRLPAQKDVGYFTVMGAEHEKQLLALRSFIESSKRQAESVKGWQQRRRCFYRLTALVRDVYELKLQAAAEARLVQEANTLLDAVNKIMASVR